ncbi:Nematode fatty acid retinoid binding family-containing protein [Strongyloides ratti]|uniref:Nematode fatty acid retinoid binding family-containing protein n=1 Tax=Strongyloides ratti TaxID=34506 RepID=A0A090LQ47_STRRB|nr:Nematode fatty acid retinoid binding family-containing protein [Strongyloides ratti]CEF69666.1 Nematode fatty acid retinoid binding family-containing protein [Strongyloides ratti]
MKFISLVCIFFVVKAKADDVVGETVNTISSQFSEGIPEIVANSIQILNEEIIKLVSERNESSSISSLIPKEILDTLDDLSLQEKVQIMKSMIVIGMKAKTKGTNLSKEDIITAFEKIPSETLDKLKTLHDTLIEKGQKVSSGVKDFFKNMIEYIHEKYTQYKNIKDLSEIPENERIQAAVKVIQGYVNLTDDDRKSIGEAFESLKNLVNNEKLLTPLKSINENSTVEDLAGAQTQILDSLMKGEFNPTV